MEQKTQKLYPSALLEKNKSEQRLEKKLTEVNTFTNWFPNIKDLITYFKDKNCKLKKKSKKLNMLFTILKSFDAIVITGITSSSNKLSVSGFMLIAIPISAATTCGLSIDHKVI